MALFATLRGAALTSLTLGGAVRLHSENIANAENENYHRQEVFFTSTNLNRPRIAQIRRVTEQGLEQRLTAQLSESAYRSTLSRYAEEIKLAAGLGVAQNTEGTPQPVLDAAFQRFESALKDWQASPESDAAYNAVLQSGRGIATTIHDIARQLQQLRFRLDETVKREVDETNRLLEQFADLNRRVVATTSQGNAATALNQREEVLRQLAAKLSLQVLDKRNGAQSLHLQSGQAVVLGAVVNRLEYDASARELKLSSGLAPISSDEINVLGGGSLSALFNLARKGTLNTATSQEEVALIAKYERQLDYLAQNLFATDPTSLNDTYRAAAAGDTATTNALTTGLFVESRNSLESRFAIEIEPSLFASDATTRKVLSPLSVQSLDDSKNILSAFEARTRTLPPAGSADDLPATLRQGATNYYGLVQGISVRLSSISVSYEDKAKAQGTLRDEFKTLLANFAGVNIDEELLRINQLQQTYTANARVIRSVNAMLDSLFAVV